MKYFMIFFIYSFIGWVMEVVWTLFTDKKLINRGFLIGPYCPIYGCGCLLLIIFLSGFKDNLVVLFFMSILICSILEYFTSFAMEKLFNARWWDYSNYKFNLNGRICAGTMIPFGVLGVLVVYFLNPLIFNNLVINKYVFYVIFLIFLIDNCVSFGIISTLKGTISNISLDCTEEITKRVKDILLNKSFLHKRLIKAFPSFISPIDRLKKLVRR